jgi:endo-1,4-beta-xylanase
VWLFAVIFLKTKNKIFRAFFLFGLSLVGAAPFNTVTQAGENSGSNGAVTVLARPHPKQGDYVEGYFSAPDTRPLGMFKNSGKNISIDSPERFFITARWFVEGYGYLYLEADNAGQFYEPGTGKLSLNYEFARSRVLRNRQVISRYRSQGLAVPGELETLQAGAERNLNEATWANNETGRAYYSDLALRLAIKIGDEVELKWAAHQQKQPGFKRPVFGIDGRHFLWARAEKIDEWVPKLFDYGTITHYVSDTWFPHFEPKEGDLRWGTKIEQYDWMKSHGMEVEARPILWPHEWVTPDWLKGKSFEDLKKYTREHATAMVKYWGDRITNWEVANEMHDWANVHQLTPSQITEIIKIACDTVRALQPHAKLIINNTMVFGEYAGMRWGSPPEGRAIRTPLLFIRDLVEAGIDFDVIGLQIYHPERDLSDLVRLLEKFEKFGKKIVISEVGAPSVSKPGDEGWAGQRWNKKSQADWAEKIYRVTGTRPSVCGVFWYDITDFRSFTPGGGVLRENGRPKEVCYRLMELKKEWDGY